MARKILLADDSVTAQNMGRKILADAGYEVVTVNNGSAALKKIAEIEPDLVVLDVYMPGYSGLEVCQRLKESSDSCRIPVLLTVGKLEPFKPEEAQRVRAEGYIVKPFEASELLSALSRLEDKVVPRAESSKPGRFARAIAAVEESNQGRSSEFGEADENGWKSRITFPQKKSEKEEAEEKAADEAAIYNPVNRDLRTVVETPAQAVAEEKEFKKYNRRKTDKQPQPADEATVDIAALASPGLPQDVTAEEVAAIAAAAAQIKALQATLEQEEVGQSPVTQAAQQEVAAQSLPANETLPEMQVVATPAPEVTPEAKLPESQFVEPAVGETRSAVAEDAAVPAPLPHLQSPPVQETLSPVESVLPEIAVQAPVAQGAEAAETIENVESRQEQTREEQIRPDQKASEEEASEAPVTMAVAHSELPASASAGSQWTAVAIALDAEEASMSLEQEMQKAYTAFIAEESAVAKPVPQPEISAPESISQPDPVAAIDEAASPEPEPTPAPQQERVAEPVATIESASEPAPTDVSAEPVASSSTAEVVATHQDVAQPVAIAEQVVAAANQAAPESVGELVPQAATEAASQPEEPATVFASTEPAAAVESEPVTAAVAHRPFTSFVQATDRKAEENRTEEEKDYKHERSEDREQNLNKDQDKGHEDDSRRVQARHPLNPEEDPEAVKTTAAAWASWRKIRDANHPRNNDPSTHEAQTHEAKTGDPAAPQLDTPAPPPDVAAMAVAAGAEHAPSDQSKTEPPQSAAEPASDVASIVDSLLADLRPKLLAEISRKMSEKK